MYTQCPNCQTTFRIAEAHLKAAKGMVRCGSCQQIFDATAHLTSGMPNEPSKPAANPRPAPARPAPPPNKGPAPPSSASLTSSTFSFEDFDEEEHDHIDLTIPVSRESMPDQTPFMESIYEENSPYNNLDEMDRIPIPGELNFGDSYIQFPDEQDDKRAQADELTDSRAKTERRPSNPYEDTEDKEAPATTRERSAIDDLYKSADLQMHEDEQLQKNIEELLSFASELDDKPPSHPDYELSPHLHELEDFEKEIDNLDFHHQPLHSTKPAEEKTTLRAPPATKPAEPTDEFAHDFEIEIEDDGELIIEDIPSRRDSIFSKPTPEAAESTAKQRPRRPTRPEASGEFRRSAGAQAKEKSEQVKPGAPAQVEKKAERIKPRTPARVEDELPSAEFEIPKALRRNFENFEPPMRPIWQTMGMIALLVILGVGFLFQLIFFRSYELANRLPALLPVLTSICSSLPCRYSGSIDVSKIELLNRDVRSHPTQKNALLISAAFINHASFDQPYPTIAVKLADLSGNIVATRHFKPEEYLDKIYSKFLLMESGTPIHITLAVLDPGDDAINFEFSFL